MKKLLSLTLILLLAGMMTVSCSKQSVAPKAGKASPDDLIGMLPADALGVFYIDIHSAMNTDLAKNLLKKASQEKDFQEFLSTTGIDLQKDVHAFAFGLFSNFDAKEPQGVGVVNLKYDKENILAMIKAKVEKEKQNLVEEDYKGLTMYSWKENNKNGYFVPFNDSNIVFGNEIPVKACLDVLTSKADNLLKNEKLADLLKKADKKAILWGAVSLSKEIMEQAASGNPMMGNAKDITGLTFAFDYKNKNYKSEIKAVSIDPSKNKQIADAINGIKGFGALMTGNNPELGEILNKIQIVSENDYVKISADIPEEIINSLIEKAEAEKAKKEETKEDI